MKISMIRAIGAVFAAALFGMICLNAHPKVGNAAPIQVVAQATEMPTEAPTEMPSAPLPANQTMAPSTTGVPTYNGKPAGTDMLNDNPNGPGWLSKFARNPGPDTSNMNMGAPRHVIIIHRVRVHVRPTPHP